MKRVVFGILIISLFGYKSNFNQNDYIRKISKKLDQIKSASYYSTKISSAPGDTKKFSEPRKFYHKIFVNPSDTLVGSSSVTFNSDDTIKMTNFYNGIVRGQVNWEKQYVKIDSFQNHPYPFRLVHYPFYTKINEILKYTLTTTDSIQTDFKTYGDSIFFSLKIINKHVYFHIKPIVIQNDYIPEDEISQFDIWFSRKDNMPYRMRSKWYHATLFESCSSANFNFDKELALNEREFFPSYFKIVQFNRAPRKDKFDMVGKKAPEWLLHDIENNEIQFNDLNSKVLLIQFTGVGCGPCHQSVPFLKQLVKDYKTKDFEFISIETWSKNMEGLKRYNQKNEFNFKFLKSTDEVTKAYDVSSVPVFFIIDEERTIRKVINGYSQTTTDKEIIDNINKLL